MKIKLIMVVTIVAAGLVACGGHHDNNNPGTSDEASSTIQGDTFLSQVNAIIATTDETSDPKPTDTITATMPETNEAAPLI